MKTRDTPQEDLIGCQPNLQKGSFPVHASDVQQISDADKRKGFILCILANIFYSLTFFLLRCLTNNQELNSDWTLFVKESVTVLTTLPFIVIPAIRGRYPFPSLKTIGWLMLSGFFCEFFGARLNLWAYAMLGLVLAIPLIQIFTLLSTLLLGAVCLRERITRKKCLAVSVLTVAVLVLAFSRKEMAPMLRESVFSSHIIWGVLVTLVAGIGYALFYVILRKVLKKPDPNAVQGTEQVRQVPPSLSMVGVCGMGVVVAGFCLLVTDGPHAFVAPPPKCWLLAIGAGFANCLAFLLQTTGIKYATASKVTLIAVIQIVFLTLIGTLVFHEESNILVWCGLALTCVGIFSSHNLE